MLGSQWSEPRQGTGFEEWLKVAAIFLPLSEFKLLKQKEPTWETKRALLGQQLRMMFSGFSRMWGRC